MEAEIKQCKEALEKVETKQIDSPRSKLAPAENNSESEDDFIEPTPIKDVTTNISRLVSWFSLF